MYLKGGIFRRELEELMQRFIHGTLEGAVLSAALALPAFAQESAPAPPLPTRTASPTEESESPAPPALPSLPTATAAPEEHVIDEMYRLSRENPARQFNDFHGANLERELPVPTFSLGEQVYVNGYLNALKLLDDDIDSATSMTDIVLLGQIKSRYNNAVEMLLPTGRRGAPGEDVREHSVHTYLRRTAMSTLRARAHEQAAQSGAVGDAQNRHAAIGEEQERTQSLLDDLLAVVVVDSRTGTNSVTGSPLAEDILAIFAQPERYMDGQAQYEGRALTLNAEQRTLVTAYASEVKKQAANAVGFEGRFRSLYDATLTALLDKQPLEGIERAKTRGDYGVLLAAMAHRTLLQPEAAREEPASRPTPEVPRPAQAERPSYEQLFAKIPKEGLTAAELAQMTQTEGTAFYRFSHEFGTSIGGVVKKWNDPVFEYAKVIIESRDSALTPDIKRGMISSAVRLIDAKYNSSDVKRDMKDGLHYMAAVGLPADRR